MEPQIISNSPEQNEELPFKLNDGTPNYQEISNFPDKDNEYIFNLIDRNTNNQTTINFPEKETNLLDLLKYLKEKTKAFKNLILTY